MSALGVLCLLAAIAALSWACWRAGVERGLAECEDKLATTQRLHAVAIADARREGRAQMGRETFQLLGENWRNQDTVIDLAAIERGES